jgi:ubiquinone/menaquinone biosynthesis C-methylase UbiE
MKLCPACSVPVVSFQTECPQCGRTCEKLNGFYTFAPELSEEGGGFKPHYFSELARLEETNFWFRARNELLISIIQKHCPAFDSFLEIGCGTAYVLSAVRRAFPDARLSGSEIFTVALDIALSRVPTATFMQMDARQIPFTDEFDVVGAFDVLEHIQEDERVLSQIHRALHQRGLLLVTVPQHAWLWSRADEYACHVRRYESSDLHDKIEEAGFQIVQSTSFVSFLLPAMFASRFLTKHSTTKAFDPYSEFNLSPWLNAVFLQILRIEQLFIRRGIKFRCGGSRLVVAQKRS